MMASRFYGGLPRTSSTGDGIQVHQSLQRCSRASRKGCSRYTGT